jgi:hypothetical protein
MLNSLRAKRNETKPSNTQDKCEWASDRESGETSRF